MPEELDSFVQDQLESFRKTCDEDFEKMKTLEQVCPLIFDNKPSSVLTMVTGVQGATPEPGFDLPEVPGCGSLRAGPRGQYGDSEEVRATSTPRCQCWEYRKEEWGFTLFLASREMG